MLIKIARPVLIALLLFPALAVANGETHHRETTMIAEAAGRPADSAPPSAEDRLDALEAGQAELYHTLAQKKAAGLATPITDRITVSGLLEVAATAENLGLAAGDSEAASDLTLATAQLGFGLEVTEEVRGNLSFLYEEDATDLEVDEAAIDLNFAPLFARLGRLYVPFGVFPSHFISDPLTLELGETRETAVLFGYGREFLSLSAFVFNGDAEKAGKDDHIRDWGASLVVAPAEGLQLGGSYLSDLADSDAELPGGDYRRRVGGWSAFATVEHGPFGASAEILGATREFSAADLDADGDGRGDQPRAWNVEVSWTPQEAVEMAVRLEGSREFAGQPATQYGMNTSWGIVDSTTLSLEYLRGEFDRGFGDGIDTRDLITAQLSLEF